MIHSFIHSFTHWFGFNYDNNNEWTHQSNNKLEGSWMWFSVLFTYHYCDYRFQYLLLPIVACSLTWHSPSFLTLLTVRFAAININQITVSMSVDNNRKKSESHSVDDDSPFTNRSLNTPKYNFRLGKLLQIKSLSIKNLIIHWLFQMIIVYLFVCLIVIWLSFPSFVSIIKSTDQLNAYIFNTFILRDPKWKTHFMCQLS